jgi:two-component system sensor histidine kinase KdpD
LKLDRHYLVATALLAFITLFSQFFRSQLELINVALIHLIPVIVIALRGDMTATMIVSASAVVLFDLFYVPPQYSFDVHDLYYVWSFVIFFVVGYTITLQAKRIHTIEIKEMLLNTLSHDLKTPLSSILGSASLLIDDERIDAETRRLLAKQIQESGQRMDRLIANLLDSARLQNDRNVLKKEWCDLEDILGVALQEFRENPRRKFLEIQVGNPMNLFWGDGTLLVRLIVNLLDNAFKYSEGEKRVRIAVGSDSEKAFIHICNDSNPIPQHELTNMFDRFYRLEQSADIRGSGIGLAICKEIATAHKGSIRAYNGKNGVCIEVLLPVLLAPSQADKGAS